MGKNLGRIILAHPLTVGAALGTLALSLLTTALPSAATLSGRGVPVAEPNTWSLVAVDPASGAVGVAGASCFPGAVDAIAALVPGRGAAAVQADFDLSNRNRVFELLQDGLGAEAIVDEVTDMANDPGVARRQYGVVVLEQGEVEVATFTGGGALDWAGARQDAEAGVVVQGNLLQDQAVVDNALAAFRAAREQDQPLAERLLRGLEAGAAAGGDRRCNTNQGQQTASAAFLMMAQPQEPAYAAPELGISEAGQPDTPSLYLSVSEPIGGENPIPLLRQAYEAQQTEVTSAESQPDSLWRRSDLVLLVAAVVTVVAMALTVVWALRRQSLPPP